MLASKISILFFTFATVIPLIAGANSIPCKSPTQSTPNCAYVRLDCPGQSMERVPVMDQGDNGMCEAYMMSSMIDAYRFSHGDKSDVHTSPVEAAIGCLSFDSYKGALKKINANYHLNDVMNDYVDAKDVLEYSKLKGVCSRELVNERIQDGEATNDKFIHDLSAIHRDYSLSKVSSAKKVAEADKCLRQLGVVFDRAEISKMLSDLNPAELVRQTIASRCEGHRQKINSKLQYKEEQGFPENFDRMRGFLLKGKKPQPVQIGFCGSLLDETGPSLKGFNGYHTSGVPKVTDDCSPHSALVIGQRMNKGKCELLIRNSWGTSCNGYDAAFDHSCEASGMWVDTEVLKANTFDFGYLKD